MIKKFYIFEQSLFSDLNKNKKDEEKIKTIIGFAEKDYELYLNNNFSYDSDFTLSFKELFLTKFLNLEENILSYASNLNSAYSNNNTYIDDSELDFIDNYLTSENSKKLNLLLNYLDVNIEDQVTSRVFNMLDNLVNFDQLKDDISEEYDNAISYNADEALEELPFGIRNSYSAFWDIDLIFHIEKIGEYIDKKKLNVSTIKEFLENVDFSYFCYESIDNRYETNYKFDYVNLNKHFEEIIDEILEIIDENDIEDVVDPNQLKLYFDNDEDLVKNKEKDYNFGELFKKIDIDKLYTAKLLGGKFLAWFESYEFQKNYMKEPNLKKYMKLKNENILNPRIEDEYDYLYMASQYNL